MVREKYEEKREANKADEFSETCSDKRNSELKRCVSSVVAKHNKENNVSQRKQQMWKPFEL